MRPMLGLSVRSCLSGEIGNGSPPQCSSQGAECATGLAGMEGKGRQCFERAAQDEATAIAERIWMQFYVHRLGPKNAADRAERAYRGVPPRDAEKSSRANRPLTLRRQQAQLRDLGTGRCESAVPSSSRF